MSVMAVKLFQLENSSERCYYSLYKLRGLGFSNPKESRKSLLQGTLSLHSSKFFQKQTYVLVHNDVSCSDKTEPLRMQSLKKSGDCFLQPGPLGAGVDYNQGKPPQPPELTGVSLEQEFAQQ